MSLLMDALKKAEEEKKQAAKRLQEVEMEAREEPSEKKDIVEKEEVVEKKTEVPELYTDTSQFSLEPLSRDDKSPDDNKEEPKEVIKDDDSVDQLEIATVDATEAFSEDLTLDRTMPGDEHYSESYEETQKEIDLNDTTIIEGLSTEDASAPFDDTFHGVVFDDEADTTFYEETLPGGSADQLVNDLGGGKFQPTPVAAKTVFTTGKKPNKKKSSFKWGVFAVLAFLAIGSFAIFYYFTITPVTRTLPSPIIARGIESDGIDKPIVVPPVIESSVESGSVDQTTTEVIIEEHQVELAENAIAQQTEENLAEQNANILSEQHSEAEIPLVESAEAIELNNVETIETAMTESKTDAVIVNEVVAQETVDEPVIDGSTSRMPIPTDIQVDASLINISKSKKQEQDNAMLSQAFNAYKDGHYDAAKSIYQGVLKNEPDNRDAHLGLAAIAIAKQDRKSAYSHYVHLLELNPLDTLSMSALIALSNSADPVKDESAIKLLIQRDGDIPYLYFSLGNLYAKQKRWADAQQAFFDAYRLDTTNPDYVLNLAISLDQMGQYDTALDYYKSAIALSQNTNSGFDPVPVNKRIFTLSKLTESKL